MCDHNGPGEYATFRLGLFLKKSEYHKFVYKSDQEGSMQTMIDEALRQCGKSGEARDDPSMLQAISENGAVGASASNGRAERAVQTFEDVCRTYKSALETRINATVLCNLPVFTWLIEHVASNLNRYSVNPDGRTP